MGKKKNVKEITKEQLQQYIHRATINLLDRLARQEKPKPDLVIIGDVSDAYIGPEISKAGGGIPFLTKKPEKKHFKKGEKSIIIGELVHRDDKNVDALKKMLPDHVEEVYVIVAITTMPPTSQVNAGHFEMPGTQFKMPWN